MGFHRIKSKNGDIISSTSINVPVVELKEEILSEKQLTKIFSTGKTSVIVLEDDKVSIQDSINSIRSGSELWRYILYLITLLLIIEMIVSNNAIRKTK